MKRNGWKVLSMAAVMTAAMTVTAFAGEWKQDGARWWWLEDDGNYPKNTWQWIDGNQDQVAECYYFDSDGYMLSDTVTPDQYTVNAEGAWTVNGVVQTQAAVQTEAESSAGNPNGGISAASVPAAGEISGIDRTIGNGFIRQEYVDCLGRSESYVRQVFGEPMEIGVEEDGDPERDIFYRYQSDYDYYKVVHFKDGIAMSLSSDVKELTWWESEDGYTEAELSSLMNVGMPVNILDTIYYWMLQEDPVVTFKYAFGMGTLLVE